MLSLKNYIFWCLCLLKSISGFYIPHWSSNYHVTGTLHIPDANVVEPFEVWYSRDLGKSRVDYYFGMVRNYQSYDDSEFGIDYKIVPYSDEVTRNIEMCFQKTGTFYDPVNLQPALYPIEDIFSYEGHVYLNGNRVQKWSRVEESIGNYQIGFSLSFYLKCHHNRHDYSEIECRPVRLEMNGTNLIFPSHVGNYFIDYESYEPNTVTNEMVEINYPHCIDLYNGVNMQKRTKTTAFSSLSDFLPGVSQIVNEDRGFARFTKQHGFRFRDQKDFRKQFSRFRNSLRRLGSKNGQRSKKTKQHQATKLIDFQKFNFAAYNKRFPIPQSHILKNQQQGPYSNYYNYYTYTNEDLQMASKYDHFDLHSSGVMNPIQSQLNCGSCWAFATAAALEGTYYMKYRKNIKLSEQVLIDCSWGYQNLGCDGGVESWALDWIMKHDGLPLHAKYGSYKANDGYCGKQNSTEIVQVHSYQRIQTNDYEAIKIALLKNGPVLTSMHASIQSLAMYTHGIYNDPACLSEPEYMDHAVVIVGFGYYAGQLYWIVRNSWSPLWGANGHLLIAADNNICGLATSPLVVFVK